MNPDFTKAQTPEQMALSGAYSLGRNFNNGTPTNQAINPQSLTPQTPLNVQTPQYPPLPAMPEAIINEQFAPQQGDQQISSIQQRIAQLTGQGAQETSRRSELLANPDIEAQRKNVMELSNQLKTIQNQANAIPLQLEQESLGKGITSRVLNAQQQSALRTNTIQALQTNSILQAAQGNLTLALDEVDRAIAAEFDPIKAELTAQRANLEMFMNDPNRTREEKRRAAIAEQQLADREKQIAQQEALKKETADARIALIRNNQNLPREALAALQQAQNPNDIAVIANAFGLTSLSQKDQFDQKMQQQKFQQDEKQFGLNYALQQAKLAEDKRQFGITNDLKEKELNQKAQEANLDPAQAIAYAQEYATTGKIPTGLPKNSFGVISQLAKEAPKQQGEIISTATGVKPSTDSTYADSLANLSSVIDIAKTLKEQDKNRIGGVASGLFGKLTGSDAQGQYMSTRQQIIDLLSRARSGAALTETEVQTYESMLPGRFSEPFGLGQNSDVRIQNFIDTLTQDLTNKAKAKGWSIYGVSKIKLDDGNDYTVGQEVVNPSGQKGRVNADGTITLI